MNIGPIKRFSGALAGASFVALTQIITRENIPCELRVAIGLFSVAIPFLIIFALLDVPGEPLAELRGRHRASWFLFTVPIALSLLGIAALFWHVLPLFAVLFALSCAFALGFLLFRAFER